MTLTKLNLILQTNIDKKKIIIINEKKKENPN